MKAICQIFLVLFVISGLLATAWTADQYDYPFYNPYRATIAGTPPEDQPRLPERIRSKELSLVPLCNRPIPQVFWYHNRLRYSLAYQKGQAPLIFIIAGTGSSHNGSTMLFLQRIFFYQGFHVISLPSPTHPNFIVTASTTGVAGNLPDDSRDLYRVMKQAYQQNENYLKITDFYLIGYSLGATQAALAGKLDEEEGFFNFKKILMINPAVSLFNSVTILDRLLDENIPGGPDHFNAFYQKMITKFSDIYRTMDQVHFDDQFLFTVIDRFSPTQEEESALIGLVFRFSSTNMIFASDVVTRTGFIVPSNRELSPFDSLTDYFKVAMRTTFVDYFNEFYYPFFRTQDPGVTPEELKNRSNLQSIATFLQESKNIGVITNRDDPIYAPGEVEYLRQLFGSRAKIYPRGGHCGNMAYRDNVEYMVNFFRNEESR